MKIKLKPQELTDMFRHMDVDGDDEIDSREFARVVRADASRTKPKSADKMMSQDNKS